MNKKMNKLFGLLAIMAASTGMTLLTACNPEPDESDMFTATGETAADYIHRKSQLTSFEYILTRSRQDRSLSSYGEYTCYAPTNDAITVYIDSLYRDASAIVLHNSMEDHGELAAGQHAELTWLSDSLCDDIARFHLATGVHNSVEMAGGATIRTMLGRTVNTQNSIDSLGRVTIESASVITEPDSVVTNGIVHIIDQVIPRSSRVMGSEFELLKSDYSIFIQALKMTGLDETMRVTSKGKTYEMADYTDTDGTLLYYPKECLVGFTLFAEPDEIIKRTLRAEGKSEDINGLIAYANEKYGNAREWYDYLEENGIDVSTGTDYTNEWNALHMFVAYHILKAGMPENQLVYEETRSNQTTWNYVNGGEPFDYYETLLPHTMMKIWQPLYTGGTKNIFINRYRAYNTLTDELPKPDEGRYGYGSDAMHQSPDNRAGVRVLRSDINKQYRTNVHALNGYIHAIDGMLLYDRLVPKGVLHERMRFDATTFLPEFINNNIRNMTMDECKALSPSKAGARVAFPLDFFDNVVSFTDGNKLRYNVKGGYNAWQADAFQGWGKYDLAMRMPPLPTGTYEMRLYYAPMSHGGMMQFYMGTAPTLSSMVAMGIPLDARILKDDPRIGWTDFTVEDDQGVSTDVALHNRGYMRGPYSFKDHAENNATEKSGVWALDYNMRRGTRNAGLRRVLGRLNMKQSQDYWFRYKSVLNDDKDLKWQLDFVEFAPVDVVDNDTYSEDWY